MQIRLAFPNEIDQIMLLIEEARAEIAKTGSDQWQKEDGYPNRNDIIDDILNGYAWVGIEDGMLIKRPLLVKDNKILQIGYRTKYKDLNLV